MSLNQITASLTTDGHVNVPTGWMQGRALYGGLVAALLYRALEQKVGQGVPLRSATINFVAPASDGPMHCQAEIFRQGKSVTQGECRAIQNGQVVAVLLASFGAARESAISIDECPPPSFSRPDAALKLPFVEGITPEFLQHYEMRWAHGGFPFTRAEKGDIGGWVRELGARDSVDYADLLALVDTWPPSVLPMLRAPAPASSMTWTIEFMPGATNGSGQQWWQYLAESEFAAEGYVHSRARLWDESGKLVAISRQTVTVFS